MKLVSSFLKKKDYLGADAWGASDKNIKQVIDPLEELFAKEFPNYNPYPAGKNRHIALLVRNILIAEALVPEYCNLFKGLSDEELISIAQSFRFENYVKRERLENILSGRE
jgi:endoglucanase